MTTTTLCQSCHTHQPNPAGIAFTAFVCTECQQKDAPHPARFLFVWKAIRARLRLTVAAVWLALYLLAMIGMGAVMVWR